MSSGRVRPNSLGRRSKTRLSEDTMIKDLPGSQPEMQELHLPTINNVGMLVWVSHCLFRVGALQAGGDLPSMVQGSR